MASEPPGGPETLLFADHVEYSAMGEYVNELRFKEPVVLHKVQVLNKGERPFASSDFEGRTFPNVRTMSLSVYASDKVAASSAMPRLVPDGAAPGLFVPQSERLVTTNVVVRGAFMRLSVVVYGRRPGAGELPEAAFPDISASLPSHLRPTSALDTDKLDLAGSEDGHDALCAAGENGLGPLLRSALLVSDTGAPPSLSRALGLSAGTPEMNARLGEHAAWVAELIVEEDVLKADVVVGRLAALVRDFMALAQGPPDPQSAHVTKGPLLTRSLFELAKRCLERYEFLPLRATLQALSATLCVAPTVAEVLKKGALAQLLSILKDPEWCQFGHKSAALQALVQLCSHAVGMEAFLGWSSPAEVHTGEHRKAGAGKPPEHVTGYDMVLQMVIDGGAGFRQLEPVALLLLQRAAFYSALVRFDSSCARLTDTAAEADGEVLRGVIHALTDVAALLDELTGASSSAASSKVGGAPGGKKESLGLQGDSLLDDEFLLAGLGDGVGLKHKISGGGKLNGVATGKASVDDPFAKLHPQLHGFIEAFIAGRRLIPGLCIVLRRLLRFPLAERLEAHEAVTRLLCGLLSCVGGAQFLSSDAQALNTLVGLLEHCAGGKVSLENCSGLVAIPRFPGPLAKNAISVSQLATLVTLHVRAMRFVLLLVSRTRQKGRDGLLPDADALPLLSALHDLCTRGGVGVGGVVSAFRSVLYVEWLLRQLEGRLDEVGAACNVAHAPPQPSIRHLVAILYNLVLRDPTASVADKFGARILSLSNRCLEFLDAGANMVDGGDGGGFGLSSSTLEFALDSDEGSLSRSVRVGRRGADEPFVRQLKELVAQLRPWQQAEGEPAPPVGGEPVSTAKLLNCVQLVKGPRSLKRSTVEERSHQLALTVGDYSGIALGVQVAEVDYLVDSANDEQVQVSDEQHPSGDLLELPLLTMRLLSRRAVGGAREGLAVALTEDSRCPGGTRDGVRALVPLLIRCAAALNLNLEALIVQKSRESVDTIYKVQHAHAELLESALQALYYMLRGLREAGIPYRHTELLHTLFLISDRLMSNLVGTLPKLSGVDPEFRLLWRHCLAWVCKVFRVWVQSYPAVTAGQLLQPLLRHLRVLPMHYASSFLLLATCGSLQPLMPSSPHSFAIVPGKSVGEAPSGEHRLSSRPLAVPISARGGAFGMLVLKLHAPENDSSFHKSHSNRSRSWGQLFDMDCEELEWESPDALNPGGPPGAAVCARDPLVRALGRKQQTVSVSSALGLVSRVNARRDRLLIDDLAELTTLVVQSAVSSDAMLHLLVVRVMEKLTEIGVPVLAMVLRLGETALHGSGGPIQQKAPDSDQGDVLPSWAPVMASPDTTGGAARDQRDARAVSRVLMLLLHFGHRSQVARQALIEHRAEALCLSVLSHGPATLPAATMTQAIRVLSLVFCHGARLEASFAEDSKEKSEVFFPAVPKCRMVTKALSLVLNRSADDAQPVLGPTAIAAALEMLLRLSSVRYMCFNLLFSATEESATNASSTSPVPVTLSCAFKLPQCAARFAHELSRADLQWNATPRKTEAETDAEEILSAWLHVGDLLIKLCQTVLANCPVVCVFLSVITPGGSAPEQVDAETLKGVFADVDSALSRIAARKRSDAIGSKSEKLKESVGAFRCSLVKAKQCAPPSTIPREEFTPPNRANRTAATGRGASKEAKASDVVVNEIMDLFEAATDLDGTQEWLAAAELDPTDAPPEKGTIAWEFDAVAHRRKRQAALDKLEFDRKAKRLKQSELMNAPAATAGASTAAGRRPPANAAPPAAPAEPATVTSPRAPPPEKKEAAPGAVKTQPKPANGSAQAATLASVQKFLEDHPEFMRVLKNPKKCLSDPRVKKMFVTELENYPLVKAFIESKGVTLRA